MKATKTRWHLASHLYRVARAVVNAHPDTEIKVTRSLSENRILQQQIWLRLALEVQAMNRAERFKVYLARAKERHL